ncbi:GntR family transcriptional regulator [Saccharopolyspora sp. WRP15-2]|uniref:GntR family transcriptional regulator n=1 Tax=Saccharopolyspora oryzae TaxID=2997343 RepID=A0ABT4V7R4_9PSEU|nr:GntR family transcriptional regulator [Saccharopolyspora oryzae]MDA3629883.1 GntR family transcriptional regulator [Saccharopolyspora oryzae]
MEVRAVNGTKEPRYLQIARDLAEEIAAQRWAVGERMPPEPELASSFEVSRETLRNALRELEARGLVSRRKGDGTRVERLTPVQRFDTSLGSLEELVQYGRDAVREVTASEEVTVGSELAATADLPPGAVLARLTTVRRAPDGSAVSWSQVYLSPDDAAAVADDLDKSTRLISDLLRERTGRSTHRVVQRVRAIALPTEPAEALGLPPGSPALEFVRHYYDATGDLFETTVGVHPGDTFSYRTTLVRSGSA